MTESSYLLKVIYFLYFLDSRNKSLSKGLMQGIETDGKENKSEPSTNFFISKINIFLPSMFKLRKYIIMNCFSDLGTDVNIITSSKEVAKRRLLEAKGKM